MKLMRNLSILVNSLPLFFLAKQVFSNFFYIIVDNQIKINKLSYHSLSLALLNIIKFKLVA